MDFLIELFYSYWVQKIIHILALSVMLLLSTAYLTLLERKFIGWAQIRQGPNVVGPYGLLQPIADAIKAMLKEVLIPYRSHFLLYVSAPFILFSLCLASFMLIPMTDNLVVAPMNIGLLLFVALSSFSVYSVVFAGWASNSIYAVMGAIRSVAQMISYELSMGFGVMSVALVSGSFDLTEIVMSQSGGILNWNIIRMFPLAAVFFVAILAETNRVPFDVAEGESEIVGGYSVEYSGLLFAFFFFGEYLGLILMSAIFNILFLGGWHAPIQVLEFQLFWFIGKTFFVILLFLWVRVTLPRMRYDTIMSFGWKFMLPFTMTWFYLCVVICTVMSS